MAGHQAAHHIASASGDNPLGIFIGVLCGWYLTTVVTFLQRKPRIGTWTVKEAVLIIIWFCAVGWWLGKVLYSLAHLIR
jgi:hypothetical protein